MGIRGVPTGCTSAGWRSPPRRARLPGPCSLVRSTSQYSLWSRAVSHATFLARCRKIGVLIGLIAVAFAAGIAAAGAGAFAWVAAGVIALAGVVVCTCRAWSLVPVVIAAGAGLCAGTAAAAPRPGLVPEDAMSLEGNVARPPERDEHGRTRVLVDTGDVRVQITV